MALELTDPHTLLKRLLEAEAALESLMHAVAYHYSLLGLDARAVGDAPDCLVNALRRADKTLQGD